MGSGKSTVSRCLCDEYGYEGLEMDEEIVRREGMTIPEIFAQKGEACFREMETELLRELNDRTELVVSCGGGVPMRECNVREMKKNGRIVLLAAKPETILGRVKGSHSRPLLEGNMNVEYIRELMEKRKPKYEAAADFAIETDRRSAEEISREILRIIGSGQK